MGGKPGVRLADWPLGFSREGGATYLPQADRRVGGTLPPPHIKNHSLEAMKAWWAFHRGYAHGNFKIQEPVSVT